MRSNNQVLQWQNLMVSEFSIRMTHDKVSKKGNSPIFFQKNVAVLIGNFEFKSNSRW